MVHVPTLMRELQASVVSWPKQQFDWTVRTVLDACC